MRVKTIHFDNETRTMFVTLEKKHWWSKWRVIEIGGNEGTPISVYDKNTRVIEQMPRLKKHVRYFIEI